MPVQCCSSSRRIVASGRLDFAAPGINVRLVVSARRQREREECCSRFSFPEENARARARISQTYHTRLCWCRNFLYNSAFPLIFCLSYDDHISKFMINRPWCNTHIIIIIVIKVTSKITQRTIYAEFWTPAAQKWGAAIESKRSISAQKRRMGKVSICLSRARAQKTHAHIQRVLYTPHTVYYFELLTVFNNKMFSKIIIIIAIIIGALIIAFYFSSSDEFLFAIASRRNEGLAPPPPLQWSPGERTAPREWSVILEARVH